MVWCWAWLMYCSMWFLSYQLAFYFWTMTVLLTLRKISMTLSCLDSFRNYSRSIKLVSEYMKLGKNIFWTFRKVFIFCFLDKRSILKSFKYFRCGDGCTLLPHCFSNKYSLLKFIDKRNNNGEFSIAMLNVPLKQTLNFSGAMN